MFYVSSVGEDFALFVGQLVGPGIQYLGDDVRSFPWWGQLVAALIALPQSQHQVAHLQVSASDASVKALVWFW